MERPATPTSRLCFLAASTTWLTRWMWEAKEATMILPFAFSKTSCKVFSDDPLGGHVAGPLGVGRVAEVGEHALLAQLGQSPEVHRLALYRA